MHRVVCLLGACALAMPAPGACATLLVDVDPAGSAADAVVYAVPATGASTAPQKREAVMDQRDRTFVPHVLVVQTGTAVRFPNSDNIRHQVYSFSPAKRFQLPLYEGTPARPVVFDRSGVVSLGCNIHDKMSAFVVVVDTPYFAVVDGGHATLDLPAGRYDVHLVVPGSRDALPPQPMTVAATDQKELTFSLRR